MRLGELSARSGVPISSIKFYLRARLLPAGHRESARQAWYDQEHVDRLQMIRSLVGAAGMSLERVREVVDSGGADDESFAWAADLLGRRWTLELVRVLAGGPRRFVDLRRDLPRVSPTVLAERLRELSAASVIGQERLAPPATSSVYRLTDRGAGLVPVVTALEAWARRSGPASAAG